MGYFSGVGPADALDGTPIANLLTSLSTLTAGTDWQGNTVYIFTQTQAQTGVYNFTLIEAGDYNVHELQPLGYQNPPTGAQDDIAVTLTSALDLMDQDFIDVPSG